MCIITTPIEFEKLTSFDKDEFLRRAEIIGKLSEEDAMKTYVGALFGGPAHPVW